MLVDQVRMMVAETLGAMSTGAVSTGAVSAGAVSAVGVTAMGGASATTNSPNRVARRIVVIGYRWS